MKNTRIIVFIRYINPLGLRFLKLLFKAKNRPEIGIDTLKQAKPLERKFLQFNVDLKNVLFLKINGKILPIMHDNVVLDLSVPLGKKKPKIQIVAYGVFARKRINIEDLKQGALDMKSINFGRSGVISNIGVQTPSLNQTLLDSPIIIPSLAFSNDTNLKTISIVSPELPMLQFNSTICLELEDLESELKNQINYG